MIASRILYRARQFWHALYAVPSVDDLDEVHSLLNPAQMALFLRMHPSEQAHSIQIMQAIVQTGADQFGERRVDVLRAALLHDVGKNCYPLRIWERVLIVLARAFAPTLVGRWGAGEASGWRRVFVVAWQHPSWGAQMAADAGASPLTVALIRRHQDVLLKGSDDFEDRMLRLLHSADHEL